jgi:hemerythrin-like metal-binding protein
MSVEWTPALAVGHAGIDGQHQELFRRVAALLQAMGSGDRSEVSRLFGFLETYVVEHFSAEERLMAGAAYAGFDVHKAAHDGFMRELAELERLWYATDVATDAVAVRATRWIREWLVGHIAGIDQALADHLRDRAV